MKKEFETHRLNELGMERAMAIAEAFDALLERVESIADGGDGRCLAITRTKLEEACFFAKKAMASAKGNNQ